ncbi:MAG: hydantoinase/oxoprolinase family protein, partial [Myxococcota bacterium]
DILALGLGGGSEVHLSSESVHVGPRSVGFRLTEEALVYGGSTLTATDIAVASGYASLGDPFLVRHLAPAQVETAVESIHRSLEDGLDRMKVSRGAVPLVLVGGGSILIDRPLAGVSKVVTHPHAHVANAVGASIAQIGGEVDRVFSYDALGRDGALQRAEEDARAQAVAAGADPNTLQVMAVEELPLAYMPGGAVRLRLKVAGDLPALGPASTRGETGS